MTPFRIDVPEADLRELSERLARTRWPEPETVDDWSQGVPLDYLKELCRYWAEEYDWRATEARLNAWPQYRTEGGIHFAHVRSARADAMPLVLTNGWPGSMAEYLEVVGPLSESFHLVLPTLPGYGFSDKPGKSGWDVHRIARAWAELMESLGYERFGVQGSDWGTSIATSLGQQAPERVIGLHLTPPIAAPDPATFGDLTESERAALADLENAREWESGYSAEQASKPQTIGYSLVDSPAGLCAWIAEKYRTWTYGELPRDAVLDCVTLYWLTATGASSARLYWESFRQVAAWFNEATADTVDVPTGCSIFPGDIPRPSRRWAARRYTDIRHWNELPAGGHFPALEQPELYVGEVRAFFDLLR